MRIEYYDGCCNQSLTIDGKETIDMPLDDVKSALCKLIKRTNDIAVLQQTLMNIVEVNGDYEDFGYCEQCCDYSRGYTMEIEDDER